MNYVKDITSDIRYLKGIGPKRAELFKKLGINSIEDLLYYFPRRYEDRTALTGIARLKAGEYYTIKARVIGFGERSSFWQRKFKIFEVVVEDASGKLPCVWFNQPYLKQYFTLGAEVILYGKADVRAGYMQMQNPEYEIINKEEKENLNYGRIIPLYSLGEKLSQRMCRRVIKSCVDEYMPSLSDILPYDIRTRHNLRNIASSILNMHFPQNASSQAEAYTRIFFEECFLLQLLFGFKRLKNNTLRGISHRIDEDFLTEFENTLAFELTASQKKVIREIKADMALTAPMHRLLQGDVGSGKTIVALYACVIAVSSGYQAAFMVPTEILAQQHFRVISHQLSALSCQGHACKVGLLTSSVAKKERQRIYTEVKNGEVGILVGTHALLQESVEFKALSVAVIDEQHKFGVHQRVSLLAKGLNPDCLIMTATPIPRTLAMTLYSDLEVSTITELPKGRIPVKTRLVHEDTRQWVYDFIREKIKSGRQGYIVYPIIEESESLELKSAMRMYEDLKKIFSGYNVGLVHGKLKQKERDERMQSFKAGEIHLLVSTVIIEVGIDIANASVMVIEHAERFGLSQLHQLRGRIGRGSYESHCILISETQAEESLRRLNVMVEENDGFKIAERDLELRGPGEFFGVRQHGIPELRVNPLGNLELLGLAKKEAQCLLQKDPSLSLRQNKGLSGALTRRFPEYDKLIGA